MRSMKWDDLRVVLAVARGGTLAAAAERLGVDQTTVARRLDAIQRTIDAKLFLRVAGRLVATETGEVACARAEQMEAHMTALEAELTGADQVPRGSVRITAVPVLASRLLVPRLAPLLRRFPNIAVEIIAEPRNIDLTKRDADVAVRLARPQSGSMLCRRLGSLSYSVYGPAQRAAETLPWIGYDEGYAHLPQARWMVRHTTPAELSQLRVNDAEGILQAVRHGLGRSLLPDLIAEADGALQRLSERPVLTREVWMLVHPDLRRLPRVAAVCDWLTEVFHLSAARPRPLE